MEWFFSVGEQQYGPVPESDLLQRIQTGEVRRETLVWNATLQGWIPAGTSDLNSLFPAVAPPPLPVRSATAPPNRTARVVNEVGVLTDKVIKDLRELTPQFLMPLDEIKSFRWLKDPGFLTIAGIGLFPLLCTHIFSDLKSAYWALALYFSTLWAVFLSQRFPSPQVTRGRTLVCFFGTGIASLTVLLLLHEVLPFQWFWRNTLGKGYLLTFFGMFFGVAIWEEACKLAMVVLMLRTSPERLSLQTMLFYGLMSGLGFGIYEGVSYQTGRNWILLGNSPGVYYLANVIRLTSLPFLHAVWTGMAAYFLALSTMYPSRKHGLMVAAILIPALLHTSHNTFDGMFEFAADFISVLALLVYQRQSAAFETACVPLREDPPNVQAPAVAGAK